MMTPCSPINAHTLAPAVDSREDPAMSQLGAKGWMLSVLLLTVSRHPASSMAMCFVYLIGTERADNLCRCQTYRTIVGETHISSDFMYPASRR